MGNARICICGHNTTDHNYHYNRNPPWGSCDWFNCECKVFSFSNETPAKTSRFGNYYPPILTEQRKPKTYFKISECDQNGKPNEIDRIRWLRQKNIPRKYNNGEYP